MATTNAAKLLLGNPPSCFLHHVAKTHSK